MQKNGEAVPFILIQQTVHDNQVQCNFRIHPKAHQIFSSDAVRNKKVAIAAVAGPQRTGKSFLSNRLLKRMTGFAVGPSTMPCTKGLWIWGEPIKVSEDTVLIIMDTEGLNSVQRDVNVDMKIFSLSILLSSVFIYNSIGHIDEKALENMSYVLRISENIKISSDVVESQTQMSKYFPYFYWVLRDFSLDLKGKSQNEYLEESLKPISNDPKDPRNSIREKIRKLFAHRRCDCFPRPVHQENKLAHIQNLTFDELRDGFKSKMKSFERTFYSSLPPKTINNKPITGAIYLNLVHEYVNAMNSGKIPKILTSVENVMAAEIRKICDNYKATYRQNMDEFMRPDKLPLQESEIQGNFRKLLGMMQVKLDEKFKIWGDVKIVRDSRQKFIQELSNDLKMRLKQNAKRGELQAIKNLKLFQQVTIPDLTDSEMITTTLVTEKQQQFTKKLTEYLQKNKGSIKYSVFTKKFPAIVFNYFSSLVARIKGVYSEEINKMKIESKNSRGQIESLRRIMKQQEQLCLMRQKEVEGLILERDKAKRALLNYEQMRKFQEQTQAMSKKDVKKELQNFKKEMIDLETENQELNQLVNRLRQQVTSLKSRQPTVIKQVANEGNKQNPTNLPNDLVYALMGLKAKLSVMNEFYDKKAKDEDLDQYMASQIQEIREDKYKQIEKIREQCRTKIENARKKTDKIKQTYEQQLKMINLHLDDIKNENIELQKKIMESPGTDSRMKGFIAEKKKFQQSLKLKQNHLNSQINLNEEKNKQIEQLKEQIQVISQKMAYLSSEKANLDYFKENFWYLLRESLNYVLQKNNKLKHAMNSLQNNDKKTLKETFASVGKKLE